MRLKNLLTFIVITFFFLYFPINIVYAQDEDIDNLVEATFEINFKSATDLIIDISINPLKLKMAGETFTYEEIKNANEQDLGSFRLLIFQMLESQLESTFSNANILNFTRPVFDGIFFNEQLNVELTSSFYGLNGTIYGYDFINGILDMSGLVNYSIPFSAEPGWNNTYFIDLGKNLDYQRTNGVIFGEKLRWIQNNWNGETSIKKADIQMKKKSPTSKDLDYEEIFISYHLDARNTQRTRLNCNLVIDKLNISTYGILPDFISNLNVLPSDGIRLFANNGILTWDEIYNNTIRDIQQKIKSTIESSNFEQSLDFNFAWDPSTTTNTTDAFEVSNMNCVPPVKANIKDNNIDLKICGIPERAVFGLINTNAALNITQNDINFGSDLEKVGLEYNVTFFLPYKIFLDGKNIFTWDENRTDFGEFKSDISKSYNEENKETLITIEVTNTDLNLLGFFTGNTELTFELNCKGVRNYNVTKIPNEFSLPNKIKLDFLNSDAIRLCIEENVFSQESVENFLTNEKEQFESILNLILPSFKISGSIEEEKFQESLVWNGNISEMDSVDSIVVSSIAKNTYPVRFHLSFLPPKFEIPYQTYNFTGIPNHDVTYKIIFPKGIIINIKDPSNSAEIKKTKDNRNYLLVKFSSDQSNLSNVVSCKMIPSAFFIIGIFSPCIISFIITLVLIIIIIIIRRKRRLRCPSKHKDDNAVDYEGEEYYIPPAPPKK